MEKISRPVLPFEQQIENAFLAGAQAAVTVTFSGGLNGSYLQVSLESKAEKVLNCIVDSKQQAVLLSSSLPEYQGQPTISKSCKIDLNAPQKVVLLERSGDFEVYLNQLFVGEFPLLVEPQRIDKIVLGGASCSVEEVAITKSAVLFNAPPAYSEVVSNKTSLNYNDSMQTPFGPTSQGSSKPGQNYNVMKPASGEMLGQGAYPNPPSYSAAAGIGSGVYRPTGIGSGTQTTPNSSGGPIGTGAQPNPPYPTNIGSGVNAVPTIGLGTSSSSYSKPPQSGFGEAYPAINAGTNYPAKPPGNPSTNTPRPPSYAVGSSPSNYPPTTMSGNRYRSSPPAGYGGPLLPNPGTNYPPRPTVAGVDAITGPMGQMNINTPYYRPSNPYSYSGGPYPPSGYPTPSGYSGPAPYPGRMPMPSGAYGYSPGQHPMGYSGSAPYYQQGYYRDHHHHYHCEPDYDPHCHHHC